MIRLATQKDLPDIIALGQEFHDMAGHPIEYDPTTCEHFLVGMLRSPETAGIFVIEREGDVVGSAGVIVSPLFFNMTNKAAAELFWFVSARHRGREESVALFNRLEEWAKEQGATTMTMTALASNPGIGALYERRGYTHNETTYIRKL